MAASLLLANKKLADRAMKNCFIVQINDNYWCDANVGYGADCSVACNNLLDSNISDDCSCAKIIWQRHGFDAW